MRGAHAEKFFFVKNKSEDVTQSEKHFSLFILYHTT